MGYFFLTLALSLNAAANIFMKLGASQLNTMKGETFTLVITKMLTNYFLIMGIGLFALNIIFYIIALSKINLSVAYPIMTSGGFLLISLFSFFFLREPITFYQILGIGLLAIGITLIAHQAA